MSLSALPDTISFVNRDCYKSPPIQTCALFAKLFIPAFEEIAACVAARRRFYRRLKAVKALLMTPVFTHWQIWQVNAVEEKKHVVVVACGRILNHLSLLHQKTVKCH